MSEQAARAVRLLSGIFSTHLHSASLQVMGVAVMRHPMRDKRQADALRNYSEGANSDERAKLARSLLSIEHPLVRRNPRISRRLVWISRILSTPILVWMLSFFYRITAGAFAGRNYALAAVCVIFCMTAFPNQLVDMRFRPLKIGEPNLTPPVFLVVGWILLLLLLFFCSVLSDAA